jgi:hypothetical protein
MGSEAISAVPVRAKTRLISGNFCLSVFSSCCCMATDWVRLVPGMRKAWMAKSPSLRLGANSVPRRVASKPDSTTATTANVTTMAFMSITRTSSGAYARLVQAMSRFSFSATRLPMNSATAAGTNVTERIMAPTRAITTVKAIGWNSLPSTPVSAKIGR